MSETEILSDEALKEVEGRRWVFSYGDERLQADESSRTVLLTVSERDSFCQTVRALKDANKALARDVVTATNQAHKYRDESESLRNQQWTAERVIEWLDDPSPKPAIHAFTAGNERQIAYRVESLRAQLAQVEDELNTARAAVAKLALEQTQP